MLGLLLRLIDGDMLGLLLSDKSSPKVALK